MKSGCSEDAREGDAVNRPAAAETRRSFVTSMLIAYGTVVGGVLGIKGIQGFATAVDEPRHTDTAGLVAGDVGVPVADGTIPAYRAMPELGGPHPIVLVVHESSGVNEHVREVCRRLAKLGYVAVAPDLFYRQGNAAAIGDHNERVARIISKVPDAEVMSDLDTAAAYAEGLPQADAARLAITGFGWGGRMVWLYAARNPALKAAVSWYGPDRPPNPLRPKNPVDVIADLKSPVLALHGAADEIIPQSAVLKRQAACRTQHKECAYQFYAGAQHGFNIEGRQHYRADAAKAGWARMLAWFKQYGAAPDGTVAAMQGGNHG
jgi:carboxymethylenebutenolidase